MWGQSGMFMRVAEAVKRYHGSNRTQFLRNELRKMAGSIPPNSVVPFDPRVRLGDIDIEVSATLVVSVLLFNGPTLQFACVNRSPLHSHSLCMFPRVVRCATSPLRIVTQFFFAFR